MKKKCFYFSIAIFLLCVSGCSSPENKTKQNDQNINKQSKPQQQVEKTKEYYDSYREKCKKDECCRTSVDRAEKAQSLLYEADKGSPTNIPCPAGYKGGMLKCLTSYQWCAKIIEKETTDKTNNCAKYQPENCPAACVVCPPCEACSSISCQTEDFCQNIGFDRSWYEKTKGIIKK
jgi:hypothetical protein